MKALVGAAIVVATVCCAAMTAAADECPTGGERVKRGGAAHDLLAMLDEGTSCPKVLTRNRFRTLLARTAPVCRLPEIRVSDMIVKTQERLKDKGIGVRLLEIAEDLDRAMPEYRSRGDDNPCASVLALYSIVREAQGR